MSIGSRIQEFRKKQGLSVDELANRLGKNRATIYRYESDDIENLPAPVLEPLAKALQTTPAVLMGWESNDMQAPPKVYPKSIKIPVLGVIAAGTPIDAVEDIIDYEEIPAKWTETGEYFGLVARGRSMEPSIFDGDIIIVKKQDFVEDKELGVVIVNGSEATIKQVRCTNTGIKLIGFNAAVFAPKEYTREEIEDLPVRIIGKAVEIRRKL